jgi:hypothetical protein
MFYNFSPNWLRYLKEKLTGMTQSTWIFSYGGYAEYQIDIKITKYDAVNERSIPTNFVSIWLSSFTEDVSIGWLWRRQAQSDDNYPKHYWVFLELNVVKIVIRNPRWLPHWILSENLSKVFLQAWLKPNFTN